MTIYGFRNQNYSKTGGYGQPYPYNGTQNESVNQWNYQPNNYLMQHNELPSRRTQETISNRELVYDHFSKMYMVFWDD